MKKILTNCPNCGAPLSSDGYCEYCKTKVRYINEVEYDTLLSSGAITEILPTEILFKFKAEDGSLVVIPFIGKPENITIEYEDRCAVGRGGSTIMKIFAGPPTVRFEMVGNVSPIKEGI